MNKLTTFFAVVLFASASNLMAQTESTTVTAASSYAGFEKKLIASDKDMQDPKKNVTPKFWLSRAGLMMDAYFVNLQYLAKDNQMLLMSFQFGEPKEKLQETKEGVTYDVYVYERVTITYLNGFVYSWVETKPLHPNPLTTAQEALDKTVELDIESKLVKKTKEEYKRLTDLFKRQAIETFMVNDFKSSFQNFESAVSVSLKPIMGGAVDTVSMFNAGMAASRAEMAEESIKYYEMALSYNYPEPTLYVFLKNKYYEKGDTAKGVETLLTGFKKFPDNQDIVAEIINYYLLTGKAQEALDYIHIAQEKDPSNVSLYFAEATLYDKQGDIEKATATYHKCLEISPDYFNAYFNLGVMHYNQSQKYFDQASKAPDNAYKQLMVQGEEELKKVIPMMKKCHELNPKDVVVMETLKSVYYRLKMTTEYEEMKAKLAAQ